VLDGVAPGLGATGFDLSSGSGSVAGSFAYDLLRARHSGRSIVVSNAAGYIPPPSGCSCRAQASSLGGAPDMMPGPCILPEASYAGSLYGLVINVIDMRHVW